MADSREIGLRVGAAFNQASSLLATLVGDGFHEPEAIGEYVASLADILIVKMNEAQGALLVAEGFANTATVPVAQAVAAPKLYSKPVTPAAPTQHAQAGDETTFSGSNRPLKLSEHAELPAWLHAQAAAKGVSEVWDNRGKENYINAIKNGLPKTPPPFRSSNEGNDTSFWPPKA